MTITTTITTLHSSIYTRKELELDIDTEDKVPSTCVLLSCLYSKLSVIEIVKEEEVENQWMEQNPLDRPSDN